MSGTLYAIDEAGALLWFRDRSNNGTQNWSKNSERLISLPSLWSQFRQVFAGEGGVFYAIAPEGDLWWFKDQANDGSRDWAVNSGNVISGGWNWGLFPSVFAGDGGIIYAITSGGDLLWFKDQANDGTPDWAPRSGSLISGNWNWYEFQSVFASSGGVLYSITSEGDLLWFKDQAGNGTQRWAPRSGKRISQLNWGLFYSVLASSGGVLYAITTAGDLLWFKDCANDGSQNWAARSGSLISQLNWARFIHVLAEH